MNSQALVLTCTVRANSAKFTKRSDLETRKKDYEFALKRWIEIADALGLDTFVLENSGNADFIRSLLQNFSSNHKMKIVECRPDATSHIHGISSGEFEMLRQIAKLNILQEYDFIWKAGGRNVVTNAKKIMRVDSEDMVCERYFAGAHTINSRFFGMTTKLWNTFLEGEVSFYESADVSSGTFLSMEHYLTHFVLEMEVRNFKQKAFKKIPIFIGNSGSTNKEIDSSLRRMAIRILNIPRALIIRLLLGSAP